MENGGWKTARSNPGHLPSSIFHSRFDSSRCRHWGGGGGRQILCLQAKRDEDMPQALDGELLEKLRCEIDREAAVEAEELAGQRRLVQRGHEADQLFDLVRLQHGPAPLALCKISLRCPGRSSLE